MPKDLRTNVIQISNPSTSISSRTQFKTISFHSFDLYANHQDEEKNKKRYAHTHYAHIALYTQNIYICIAFYIDTAVKVRNGYSSPRHLAHPTIDSTPEIEKRVKKRNEKDVPLEKRSLTPFDL